VSCTTSHGPRHQGCTVHPLPDLQFLRAERSSLAHLFCYIDRLAFHQFEIMSATAKKADVASGLSKLTLGTTTKPAKTTKTKAKKPVVDSWEDEDVSSGSESDGSTAGGEENAKEGLSAPPPTPMTPTYRTSGGPWTATTEHMSHSIPQAGDSSPSRRPEKTDAVARRMIASALGVKVPKLTEEQKAYDKAIRDQEKKRREAERTVEKERQAQAEKAKAAVWDD
jgi:hypothetical protein